MNPGGKKESPQNPQQQQTDVTRRRFFTLMGLGIGWGGFAAALGGSGVGALRYMFPNVLYEPPRFSKSESRKITESASTTS